MILLPCRLRWIHWHLQASRQPPPSVQIIFRLLRWWTRRYKQFNSSDSESTWSAAAAVCSQMKVSNSSNSTSDDPPLNDMRQRRNDRTRNVVVSGIAENRDDTIWRSTMVDVLCKAAGRTVQILDAFRIGGRFDMRKTRRILIKLQSVWTDALCSAENNIGVILWSTRSRGPTFMCVPNLKQIMLNSFKSYERSQNFEIGSRDPKPRSF